MYNKGHLINEYSRDELSGFNVMHAIGKRLPAQIVSRRANTHMCYTYIEMAIHTMHSFERKKTRSFVARDDNANCDSEHYIFISILKVSWK